MGTLYQHLLKNPFSKRWVWITENQKNETTDQKNKQLNLNSENLFLKLVTCDPATNTGWWRIANTMQQFMVGKGTYSS